MIRIERTTGLAASAAVVWEHATSTDGINRELAPVRMSFPEEGLGDAAPPVLGEPLFTSTLTLGPIPFDRHRLTLVEWEPGVGFLEESTSLLHRRWRHRRRITPKDSGCVLTDVVEVEPRIPGAEAATRWVVSRILDRRHAVLAATFGRR